MEPTFFDGETRKQLTSRSHQPRRVMAQLAKEQRLLAEVFSQQLSAAVIGSNQTQNRCIVQTSDHLNKAKKSTFSKLFKKKFN